MPSSPTRKRTSRKRYLLQKPMGLLAPRVQAVGPEHFGIVSVDCAKARSRYMLADFYGRVLLEPTSLPHSRGDFQAAIDRVRQAMQQYELRDLIVAIERTGDYHRPVQRAFRQAGLETRLVHPYASKQYRQPADPGNKTDDTDLAGIFRAASHGFGLVEAPWPDDYVSLQLLRRHRRDLVKKNSILCCQIRETLHAAMPGFADCFTHLWESPGALAIARHAGSAAAVRQLGRTGLQQLLVQAGVTPRPETLHTVLAWADNAPPGHGHSDLLGQIFRRLDDDRLQKTKEISELEGTLAPFVVRTPYLLLLAIPGINIVSSADLAGELGPIELYANANAITGRAGLMPSRYQSDAVDHCGPLRRIANRRLRAVLMLIADNLVTCNHHFRARADQWRRLDKDPRWIRVKIAKTFSRLAFAMIAGRRLFAHRCCQPRHYILSKLLGFHSEHGTPLTLVQRDLEAAIAQLPRNIHAQEARPLLDELDQLAQRRRGPQPLADILPIVLARLGVRQLQSDREGDLS
jgi:transposase